MTDKQIIIDGVDVSGCAYYSGGKCTNSHIIQSNCKNVAVCYYKEYKLKEQECERLKDTYKKRLKIFCDMYNQLKAENKELKNFHINLVGVKECEIKELIKYKEALKEIKEIAIAEDINNECEYTLFGSCAAKAKNQILQKISEVIDERI